MKQSVSERIFQGINICILTLIALIIILPFMQIISTSVSSNEAVISHSVYIIPTTFTLAAYNEIIRQGVFLRSLLNTFGITVVATLLSLLVNIMAAYGFSKQFYAKRLVTYLFVLTMYFSGGLIPSYMLVSKWLHMYNNYLAFILPGLVNVFYIIVIRSQIEAVPPSLSEAAIIDGASEFQVMTRVVVPAISATIAAIGMFVVLATWNIWFPVLIYSNKREMWSLQYYLRAVVFDKFIENFSINQGASAITEIERVNPVNYQMAAIILVALPIISVYPFVQKYFVKGILAGSVKG